MEKTIEIKKEEKNKIFGYWNRITNNPLYTGIEKNPGYKFINELFSKSHNSNGNLEISIEDARKILSNWDNVKYCELVIEKTLSILDDKGFIALNQFFNGFMELEQKTLEETLL